MKTFYRTNNLVVLVENSDGCVCVCPSEIFGMLVQLDPIYVKFERSKGYRSKLGLV